MLSRNMLERPTMPYRGVNFDSKLEQQVAQQLDGFGILWEWSKRTNYPVYYEPDFAVSAGPNCDPRMGKFLPRWIEVKPQSLIYELRTVLGIPDLFDEEEQTTRPQTASELEAMGIEEFHKPKRLAEASGGAVLVCEALNRVRTLSVTMLPDRMLWQRNHPIVNWRGYLQKAQREEERARWQREAEERRQQIEAEQAQREEERRRQFVAVVRDWNESEARYPGTCRSCFAPKAASDLWLFRDAGGPYVVLCEDCVRYLRFSPRSVL